MTRETRQTRTSWLQQCAGDGNSVSLLYRGRRLAASEQSWAAIHRRRMAQSLRGLGGIRSNRGADMNPALLTVSSDDC